MFLFFSAFRLEAFFSCRYINSKFLFLFHFLLFLFFPFFPFFPYSISFLFLSSLAYISFFLSSLSFPSFEFSSLIFPSFILFLLPKKEEDTFYYKHEEERHVFGSLKVPFFCYYEEKIFLSAII